MKIDLTPIDKQILAKHDPGVRGRALIELAIVDALIQAAKTSGHLLGVEGEEKEATNADIDAFKLALFNLDDAVVLVSTGKGRKAFGWIKLVFGNDGWDLVSDYSVNLEEFLKPVDEIAKLLGG